MSDHEYRDKARVSPEREFLRRVLPNGNQGMTIEDVDVLQNIHGERYATDWTGEFRGLEFKIAKGELVVAQEIVFGKIDRALRDALGSRWHGYYLVWTATDAYDHEDRFIVTRLIDHEEREMNHDQFVRWANFNRKLP